jgi:hypothetical protein
LGIAMDQVLKKAMEKRDEAIREVERWEISARATSAGQIRTR